MSHGARYEGKSLLTQENAKNGHAVCSLENGPGEAKVDERGEEEAIAWAQAREIVS